MWTSFCLLSFGLGLGACSFAPDLSAYPECSPTGYCAPGCTCFEGQVCVPEDPEDRFSPPSFCDPRNNCAADILNDPLNCGECGNVCQFDNASAICDRGVCRMGNCDTGWDNCGEPNNLGCYDSLDSVLNCGACGDSCAWMQSEQPTCVNGLCQFDCDEGWEDCDERGDNGCEAEMGTLAYCTSCEDVCDPDGTCTDQGCIAPECFSPLVDCGITSCVDIRTDSDHCGGCFESCAGDLPCEGGFCGGMGISCLERPACTVGEQACCISSDGSAYCVAPNACGDTGSVELQCDSADDCEVGQDCCMPEFVGNASAFCTAGCLEDTVLCSRDSQCPHTTSCLMDSSGHYMTCQ